MRRRRILYGLALIAAVLFQILYDRYLARFVLAGVISLPILSLLLSLPAVVCLRLRLEGDGQENCRGAAGQWRLCIKRPAFLPIPRLTLRLQLRNDMTGWTEKRRVVCTGALTVPVPADHCGQITCRAARVRLLDCLGLFAFPVRPPVPAAALVLPAPGRQEKLPDLKLTDAPAVTQGDRQVPSGDYELRDYRAGDPLRSVHWKLSSKREELVVREWQGTCRPRVILAVDRFGDPARLDRVLDRLYAWSAELLARECPHLVQWEEDGSVRTLSVSDRDSLLACIKELLSRRAPLTGTSMEKLLSPMQDIPTVFVTAGEEETL